jgi:hypothetical protein
MGIFLFPPDLESLHLFKVESSNEKVLDICSAREH